MKPADKAFLDGLRKSVCVDVPQDHWDLVVKAVDDAGDIRDVTGYARTIILQGVEKGRFASRSEAARYAANMRWKGQGDATRGTKQADEKIKQRRSDDSAKREAKETADRILLEADAERAKAMLARGGLSRYQTQWAKDKISAHNERRSEGKVSEKQQADFDELQSITRADVKGGVTDAKGALRAIDNAGKAGIGTTEGKNYLRQAKNLLVEADLTAHADLVDSILGTEKTDKPTTPKVGTPGPDFDSRSGFKGPKYQGYRPVKEVAIDVRRDLKDAVANGELPQGLKFSVKSDNRGTNAVRVRVSGLPRTRDEYGRLTGESKAVYDKVNNIVNAYNRDNSDIMTDYFDVDYYGTVQLDD